MRESDMEGIIELSSTVLLFYWPRMSACSKQHSQSQLSCVSFASLERDVRLERSGLLGAGRARGSERRNQLRFRPLEQWQIVHASLGWMVAALAHTLRLSIWKCICIFSPT